MTALDGLERDLVIVACAISAGTHGALVPGHLEEGAGAGLGFLASAALLGALTVALTVRPSAMLPLVGAAVMLAGLIGAYALAITTGVPVLHPAVEPVDGLAVATKLVEAVGLVAAARLLRRSHSAGVSTHPHPKGLLT